MANLFRPRQSFLQLNQWQNAALNGLHYNTSIQGAVISLIYGTTRVNTNLLDFGDYKGPSGSKGKSGSLPISGTNSRAAKGGSSKSGKKSTPDYTVDVALAIGQGPIAGIGNVYTSAGEASFGSLPLNLYLGNDGQAVDPTFAGLGHFVGYSGTAYLTATPLDLGPSPVLPNIGVEVLGFLIAISTGSYSNDANPANIITDFLTNTRYGAGFPSVNLDDLTTLTGVSYAEYCQAAQLLVSVALDGHQKAIEWLDSIAKLTNTAMFFSGKLLKFKPYGDLPLSINGASWTPNLIPEYAVTDYHFLPWRQHTPGREPSPGEDDPILVTRTNSADADNWLSIEYTDKGNFYNSTTLTVNDQGLTDTYGLRIGDSIPGRAFTNSTSAQISAQLALQRKTYIRNSPYKIQLGWQFARLEPMDIITLTGRYADLYLNQQPIRILSIEEDDAGGLTIEGEEIQTGVAPNVIPPSGTPPSPFLQSGSWQFSPTVLSGGSSVSVPDTSGNTPGLSLAADPYGVPPTVALAVIGTTSSSSAPAPTVTGITNNLGLTFLLRKRFGHSLPPSHGTNLEIWYAVIPPVDVGSLLTATATLSGFAAGAAMGLISFLNVDTSIIWDTNVSLPASAAGNLTVPGLTISTTASNTQVFMFSDSNEAFGNAYGSPDSGWGYPFSRPIYGSFGGPNYFGNQGRYTTPQSGLFVNLQGGTNGLSPMNPTNVGYLLIIDALVGM